MAREEHEEDIIFTYDCATRTRRAFFEEQVTKWFFGHLRVEIIAFSVHLPQRNLSPRRSQTFQTSSKCSGTYQNMVHTLEDKFLFVGVKPYLSANEIEFLRITLAGNRVNWDKLLTLAYYHHCMPLLYWNLKGMDDAYVPIRILTELKKSYLYA